MICSNQLQVSIVKSNTVQITHLTKKGRLHLKNTMIIIIFIMNQQIQDLITTIIKNRSTKITKYQWGKN